MKKLLPEQILTRKKMGFPVPIGKWFRSYHKKLIDRYVLSERAMQRGIFDSETVRGIVDRHRRGEDHDEQLWSLLNFELWQRIFIDGESRDGISMD